MNIQDLEIFGISVIVVFSLCLGLIIGHATAGDSWLSRQINVWGKRFLFVTGVMIIFTIFVLPMIATSMEEGIYHTELTDQFAWVLVSIVMILSLWAANTLIKIRPPIIDDPNKEDKPTVKQSRRRVKI